jgi:hypothetical protein
MAAAGGGFANDDHDNVFTAANGLEPASEQSGAGETRAAAYLVGINQSVGDALAMFRKQVGMPLGNVPFPLVSQLDLSVQVWALEMCRHYNSNRHYYSIGHPPWASITSSISSINRIVSLSATTMRW